MKSKTWPEHNVIRMDLGSSETDPIQVMIHEHHSIQATQYDMHYPLELGVVLQGSMKRYYRDFAMEVKPGEIWLNGIWEPHGFQILETPCRVVAITVLPQLLAGLQLPGAPEFNWLLPFTASLANRPMPFSASAESIISITEKILQHRNGNKAVDKIRLRVHLMELLLEICANWETPDPVPDERQNPYARLSRAMEMVISSRKMITVQEAARVSGMSRNIFSRKFSQLMGVSFPNFCLRHRLSGAAAQLLNSNDSIAEIAKDWDFTDVSHLYHRFKAHYGCSPRQYRQNTGHPR